MGKATPTPASPPFGSCPATIPAYRISVGRSLIGPVSVRPGPGPYETVGRFFDAGLAPPPRNRPFALASVPTVSWYGSTRDGASPCGLPGRQCIEPSGQAFLSASGFTDSRRVLARFTPCANRPETLRGRRAGFLFVLSCLIAAQAMPPRLSSSIRRPALMARPTEWPAGTHRPASGARLSFCSGRRARQRPLSGESASARLRPPN